MLNRLISFIRSPWMPLLFLVAAIPVIVRFSLGPETVPWAIRSGMMFVAVLAALMLSLLWAVFLSRWSWWWRLGLPLGLGLVVGISSQLFRLETDSDVTPRLIWRNAPAADRVPAEGQRTVVRAAEQTVGHACPGLFGEDRRGCFPTCLVQTDWQAHPPQVCWRRPVGAGWCGFAVTADRVVTQEQQGAEEVVSCYALNDGRPLWRHARPVHHQSRLGGIGPRSTPTIVGNAVYAFGGTGLLSCLSLDQGTLRWEVPAGGSRTPEWGFAAAPLVVDEVVVVTSTAPGGCLVAFALADGTPRWRAINEPDPGYSSPMLARVLGENRILFHTRQLQAVDPRSGTVTWTVGEPSPQPRTPQPVVLNEQELLIIGGYGAGARRYRLDRQADGQVSAQPVWHSLRLQPGFSHHVVLNHAVFGLSDGTFTALDLASGDRLWTGPRAGHGQMLQLGEHILATYEKRGAIALLAPERQGFRELAVFDCLPGQFLNPPAFAAPYLLIRNQTEALCLELPLATRRQISPRPSSQQ